jgi:hypothetical protein
MVFVGRTLRFVINAERSDASGNKTAPEPVDAGSLMPLTETTKTGIAQTTRNAEIEDLPSNSRRLDTFVLLTPATTRDAATGEIVFGNVPGSVVYLDGIVANNTYFSQTPGIANHVSQDATYELQTSPVGSNVEAGHTMGGVVNVASHTGTSQFHGAVYGYRRIPSLGTASRFALGRNLLQKQSQAGASVGGPIWPHKIFFFANAEVLSGHFDGLNRITNPLIADSTGTTVAAANCKATGPQCATAVSIIQPQMNVPLHFSDRWANALARIDYHITSRHTFGIEGNGMNARAPLQAEINSTPANGGLLGTGNDTENTRFAKAYWTFAPYQFMLNDVRAGYATDKFFQPASTPGATGNLGVIVAGSVVGATQPDALSVNEHRYDLVDNFTLTTATHMIQTGVEFLRRIDNINQLQNANGLYVYPTLTAYATDLGGINQRDYSSFTQSFGDPSREPNLLERNVYAQDTWRAMSRLTVIGGVRWDKFKPAQPTPSSSFFNSGQVPAPDVNWAPRVGVAFQTEEHTVIRLGYSWFYSPLPGQVYDALYRGNGVLQSNYTFYPLQSGAPVYPKIFPSASAVTGGAQNLFNTISKLRSPRAQQITISVEERFSNDISVTASFVSNRGYSLYTATDTNYTAPTVSKTYNIDDASGNQTGTYTTQIYSTRSDNTHEHVYQLTNGGSSWYTAGVLQVQKRMGMGFSAQAAYTYSNAKTDSSGPLAYNAAPVSYAPSNFGGDKGVSPWGPKNRGTLGIIWRPLLGPNFNTLSRALVNGWAATSIVTLSSSQYATPLTIVTAQQFAGTTLLYPDTLNGYGGWGRAPFLGVGAYPTGSMHTWDARVSRTFSFTERFKATVLIEGFNLLNNQFTTGVNTIAYTATSGVLKPVPFAGAANAAQGYPQGTNARSAQAAFRLVF